MSVGMISILIVTVFNIVIALVSISYYHKLEHGSYVVMPLHFLKSACNELINN